MLSEFTQAIDRFIPVEYLPLVLIAFFASMIISEFNEYRDIKKFKFSKKVKAYGHALTLCVEFLMLTFIMALFVIMFFLSFKMGAFLELNWFFESLIILAMFMVAGGISSLITVVVGHHLYDHSENAQKLLRLREKVTHESVLWNDLEKTRLISEMQESYRSDLKKNFWKFKIDS